MPILSGDVKLLKSANMADVDEGGGAPTGNAIPDGVSNSIFPDISELDRAGGRVSLRKTFVAIQTDDTDTYFGGNVIVAEPPEDPRVSVSLFSTESTFDTRDDARVRLEAYLNKGAEWDGYLYENHITGQAAIQLFMRTTATLPTVGKTLCLVQNEGTGTEKEQYVRVISVSSETRTFTYLSGGSPVDYQAAVVTCGISDTLRHDFTGSPATRTFTRAANSTLTRDTLVADAASYVSVVPLTTTAALGAFTVAGSSIFTQLVPSAQTETPISDVRVNGLGNGLTATGNAITRSLTLAFTTTQSMHVGAAILPGSLSVERSGVTVTDSGGLLVSGGTQVGTVDYDNGILSLSSNVFGTSGGAHTVTFTPAALPEYVSETAAVRIAIENRSLSYAFTLNELPLPGTLNISYLAQGRWYVLRDDKAGAIRGTDTAFGTGTINYTTGSILITLGALPDVGGALLVFFGSGAKSSKSPDTYLENGGKLFCAFNSDGALGEVQAASAWNWGTTTTITWLDKTATALAGAVSGDASGTIDYPNGIIRLSPNVLPPAGTAFSVTTTKNTLAASESVTLPSGVIGGGGPIKQGSVRINVQFNLVFSWTAYGAYTGGTQTTGYIANVYDKAGTLYAQFYNGAEVACGSVNYTDGTFSINSIGALNASQYGTGPVIYLQTSNSGGFVGGGSVFFNKYQGAKTVSATLASGTAWATYSNAADVVGTFTVTPVEYKARVGANPADYALEGVTFNLTAANFYKQNATGQLVLNPDPATGVGTVVGSVSAQLGEASLSVWPSVSPAIGGWTGLWKPPSETATAPFEGSHAFFRVAAAPVRPGSMSILGTLADGTTFNITAGTDGVINHARVKGRVDYEFGWVELYFVTPGTGLDLSFLNIPGVTTVAPSPAKLWTLRYNAVAYSYLPLDADILGIDPVRLPSDGRVPIFRPGGFAVVGHTGEITATVANGQTVNCARVRLSRVRVIGADGVVINTGYTNDLEAGTVTFTDVSGYSQPVTIQHRIEDMAVVRQTNINGEITFTRPLTHDYPLGSFVSSALIAGDLFSRVSVMFDQGTWNGTWADTASGSAATGTFNAATYPVEVTNRGALTERWVVRFTNTTAFEVIGENVGVIAVGSTGTTCAPVNPRTGAPYFSIPAAGWGAGWATGNVLRFNTIGAEFPVWVVRTVQQGPETVPDDSFTILIRGDVNA